MNYYIADLHLGHENVLKFDSRPFLSIEEHDNTIIKNWNNTVTNDDDIYILGDFTLKGSVFALEKLKQLKGNKHLIIGNHDEKILKNKEVEECFCELTYYKDIIDDGCRIVLCHYPICAFNRHYYGTYHFYGHVHTGAEYQVILETQTKLKELFGQNSCKMYNVCCSLIGYTPRTFKEIVKI